MTDPDQVKGWAAIGIAVMGFLISVGTWLQKIRSHSKQIQQLQGAVIAIQEDFQKKLFKNDSQPVYVSMAVFEKVQSACSSSINASIAKVEAKVDTLINLHLSNNGNKDKKE